MTMSTLDQYTLNSELTFAPKPMKYDKSVFANKLNLSRMSPSSVEQ